MLDLSCKGGVGEVSRLDSGHLAQDGTTNQGKVTYDIKQLVTCRLVVEIKLNVVQDTSLLHRDFRFLEESRNVVEFLRRNVFVDKHDGIGQVAAFDEVTA